jgi:AhpD family alkylhydroperoxidase
MSQSDDKKRLDAFRNDRELKDKQIMDLDHRQIKRFFNLGTNAYRDGALPGDTKELLGLVASTVLRCNDCIDYHLDQCAEAGWNRAEIVDALNVALVVGGSIVIPHMRHAMGTLNALEEEGTLQVDEEV